MPRLRRVDTDFPCLSQIETNDCVPACVANVTAYLGHPIGVAEASTLLGTTEEGTRLKWLSVLPRVGAKPIATEDIEDYLEIDFPVIAYLGIVDVIQAMNVLEYLPEAAEVQHAVVVVAMEGPNVIFYDPARALSGLADNDFTRCDKDEFCE